MASQRQENAGQTTRSQSARRIAREACPDTSATEVLREFLRDTCPPPESLSPEEKRFSAVPNRPRTKVFFKTILRNNASNHHSAILRSSTAGLLLPHNCVILRQAVPGQNQQYYRIVRDSSQLDSLETKSIFVVNYQFERHDVDTARPESNMIRKKSRNKKHALAEDSPSHSVSVGTKHKFRVQARSKRVGSPKQNKSRHEKVSGTNKGDNQDVEFMAGSMSLAGISTPSSEAVMAHRDFESTNQQMQDLPQQDLPINNVPQIEDLTPGSAFPASDLIKSWGRRRSIPSTKSSPSRLQGIHKTRVSNPMTSMVSARISAAHPPLPTMFPNSPTGNLSIMNRSTPLLSHSYSNTTKRRASLMKLGTPKSQPQQILNRSRPRMRDLIPMALISHPSNPSLRSTSPVTVSNQQEIGIAAHCTKTISMDVTHNDSSARRHDLILRSSRRQDDLSKPMNGRSPTKKPTSLSVDLGLPTTPPPRTPLPAVPGNSYGKILSYQGRTSLQDCTGKLSNDLLRNDQESPYQTSSRATERISIGSLISASQLPMVKSAMNDGSEYYVPNGRKMPKTLEEESELAASNVSELGWPQPPKTSPTRHGQWLLAESVDMQATQKAVSYSAREMQTRNLKQRHVQNTQDQIAVHRNSRDISINSKASPITINEQNAQQNAHTVSKVTTTSFLSNEPGYIQTSVNPPEVKSARNLNFSGIKTNAIFDPRSTLGSKPHYSINGRIVYRSHSTQMTPRKQSSSSDSGSVTSNDDTLIAHYLRPRSTIGLTVADDIPHGTTATTTDMTQEAVAVTSQSTLEDAVLNRFEALVTAMEHRLYKRLSEELTTRHTQSGHQYSLGKTATTLPDT